ncbi:MAG: CDP-alcohol phosphatidyltransferase family protein [Halofilum sp. (in: g-proteobacteria)]|nr:CDP-alcohol phosphatidyltransferase family protein [Halofilum sp. (in: g-proteobacteria)]
MKLTLPTVLTLGRIALVPVLVVLFYLPYEWSGPTAAAVFALGGATDWLDGYLARRLNQHSAFGAFLDPVADKVMVAIVLVMLVQADPTLWMALPAMVIIGREIVDLRPARVDGRERPARAGGGQRPGQGQDHRPDRGAAADALPGARSCGCRPSPMGVGPALHGGRADPLQHGRVPARGHRRGRPGARGGRLSGPAGGRGAGLDRANPLNRMPNCTAGIAQW